MYVGVGVRVVGRGWVCVCVDVCVGQNMYVCVDAAPAPSPSFSPHRLLTTPPNAHVTHQTHVRVYHLLKQALVKKLLSGCKWISAMDVHSSGVCTHCFVCIFVCIYLCIYIPTTQPLNHLTQPPPPKKQTIKQTNHLSNPKIDLSKHRGPRAALVVRPARRVVRPRPLLHALPHPQVPHQGPLVSPCLLSVCLHSLPVCLVGCA
jgi:hypothetical protein